VEKGETSFKPGPIIAELQRAGFPASIEKGKVIFRKSMTIVKEGEIIPENVAAMLTKLEIYPMEVGLQLKGVYDRGEIYADDYEGWYSKSEERFWTEKDLSESGLGADVPPQQGSWVKIGKLCGVRRADSNQWWVGVIRRLDAATGARVATGIEVLSKTPYSLWLKRVGTDGHLASNWASSSGSHRYDYVEAVMLVPEFEAGAKEIKLVMKPKDFMPDLVCEALLGDKPRLIRFGVAVDTGDDFVIVSCQWM